MDLRQIIAELQAQGHSEGSLRPFKLHWDHQLYKALDYQYRMGLESLNEIMPEIKVRTIVVCGSILGRSCYFTCWLPLHNQPNLFS